MTVIDPYRERDGLAKVQADLVKLPDESAAVIAANVASHLGFARERLGVTLTPGARILDFGCGIGQTVRALLALGYDAHGVDVMELWDGDFDQYWAIAEKPDAALASRLRRVDPANYRLPYPDGHFDFVLSDQVMEHVSDYRAVFAELTRVLKPGAISLHRFPGPGRPVENHLGVPLPPLCFNRAYLALWALAGLRNARQRHLGWRQTLSSNVDMMRYNHYPTKRRLRAFARAAHVEIAFVEREDLVFRGGGRLSFAIRAAARLGLDGLLLRLLEPLLQRYMVLRSSQGAVRREAA